MTMPPRPSRPTRLAGRRAAPPPPRLGRAIAALLAKRAGMSSATGPSLAEIAARWPEIVGPRAARMCSPLKLTGRGRDGALHVAARGPAAVLIEAESRRIVERVNTYCGQVVAGRLTIVRESARAPQSPQTQARATGLTPSERLALERGLEGVSHPSLKAALLKYGGGVTRRAKASL